MRSREKARSNLVATLSPELKGPLTSLALSAQLLERSTSLSEQQRELVSAVEEDISRLKHVPNELLELARSTAAAIPLHNIPLT